MKVAVTAASGQLGRAIVRQLLETQDKKNVVAIVRTPEKARDLGVEVRRADYNQEDDFLKSLTDIDVVLIVSGMDDPDKRVQQHRNVINGAKQAGVRKIVLKRQQAEII